MQTKEVIKAGRLKLGLNEQQFGARIGVSRGAVQQWESGADGQRLRKRAMQRLALPAWCWLSLSCLAAEAAPATRTASTPVASPRPTGRSANPDTPRTSLPPKKGGFFSFAVLVSLALDSLSCYYLASTGKHKEYRDGRGRRHLRQLQRQRRRHV